ncbi:hypothetical protein [Sphingobacterium psychroaquaticum]|uniref:hypothetical protein n=1 Tax=Sphingobacterium psychroaquaticum TaxID=561061 RepID=UPI001181C310|nr:hypothetical protein [Sphingobacterium psychroaquaticum]
MKYAFSSHPSVNELHVTSDDLMFLNASDAKNHAVSLDDKEVTIAKRSDYVTAAKLPVDDNQLDLEREALISKHTELFGKPPAKTAGIEKLKVKIETEEKRLLEVAAQETEAKKNDIPVDKKPGSDEEE